MPGLIWVFAGRTATLLILSWGGSIDLAAVFFVEYCYWRIYVEIFYTIYLNITFSRILSWLKIIAVQIIWLIFVVRMMSSIKAIKTSGSFCLVSPRKTCSEFSDKALKYWLQFIVNDPSSGAQSLVWDSAQGLYVMQLGSLVGSGWKTISKGKNCKLNLHICFYRVLSWSLLY